MKIFLLSYKILLKIENITCVLNMDISLG
jgi:hypothetical protein